MTGRFRFLGWMTAVLIAFVVLVLWLLEMGGDRGPAARVDLSPARSLDALRPDLVPAEAMPELLESDSSSVDSRSVAAEGRERGALLVRFLWHGGEPAVGVRFRLVEWASRSPLSHATVATTDHHGESRFDGLSPGHLTVYGDRGGSASDDLLDGSETELVVTIPAGRLLQGFVEDERGVPVPGADIWLSAYGSRSRGLVVARSDAAGGFAVRDVGAGRYVGARHAAYQPSATVLIEDQAVDSIMLVLRDGGGVLRGLVTGIEGEGLPGATVLVGSDDGWPVPPGAIGGSGPAPFWAETNSAGVFELEGLPLGSTVVQARAEGFAPLAQSVSIDAGIVTDTLLMLEAESILKGVVVDESGGPLDDVFVIVGPYGEFASCSAISDAQGRYELGGLPSGVVEPLAGRRGFLSAGTRLRVGPSQITTWNPVLRAGTTISGRVVSEKTEEPLEGLAVVVKSDPDAPTWRAQTLTDGEGRFALSGLHPTTWVVEVRTPNSAASPPLAQVHDVASGTRDLVVRVRDAKPGRLSGRVRMPDGEIPVEGRVELLPLDGQRPRLRVSIRPDDGGFVAEEVPAGHYAVRVLVPGHSLRSPVRATVYEKATTELGVLTLGEGGRLLVKVSSAGDVDIENLRLWLESRDGAQSVGFAFEDGLYRSEAVAAGAYLLSVRGLGIAVLHRAVEIEAEREEIIDVTVRPGVPLVIALEWAGGRHLRTDVRVVIRDAWDQVAYERPPSDLMASELLLRVYLESGNYRVEAGDGSGRTAEGDVSLATVNGATIRLAMR